MNISSNYNIPVIYNQITGKNMAGANNTQAALNTGPAQDVFQKTSTTQISQITPMAAVWNEQRIENIYNKTYAKVMSQNPVTKDLNITKPELNFNSDEESSALATYTAATNEIIIQDKSFFENDLYLVRVADSNNELVDIKIFTEEDIKKYPELKTSIEKLSDSEKEHYISSMFAHELRHCIQDHLIMSTDGCKESFMARITELKQSAEEVIKLKQELAEIQGKPPVSSSKEELKKLDYWFKYQPKKVFDKNSLFKFSQFPSDNRYWSVKNHLLEAYNTDRRESNVSYYNSPLEIDAFNYQSEFLVTQEKEYPKGSLRKDVAKDMYLAAKLNSDDLNFSFIRQ